jgi:hypothetical protein
VGADLQPDRLKISADLAYVGTPALPAGWLQPAHAPAPFDALFPKTTTLFVRARLDVARLRAVPPFLRARMLPPLPGLDQLPLPSASELVDLIDGEVAAAVLGLDPDATVNHLLAGAFLPEEVLQLTHAAVAVRVRDPAAGRAALEQLAERSRQAQWVVAAVTGGGWAGYALVTHRRLRPWRAPRHAPKAQPPPVRPRRYTVALKGDTLLLLTGRGEVQRFFDVGDGRAAALATVVEGAAPGLVDAALTDPTVALGVVLTLTRITRELADKGVPPYFLKMINDVRSLAATLRVREDGLTVDVEVSL